MVITEIRPESKSGRYLIVAVNDEDMFIISQKALRELELFVGLEVSEEDLNKIYDSVLVNEAYIRSIGILSKRDMTESDTRIKLKKRFYPESVTNKVIERLKKERFLSDERYAENYIYNNHVRESKKMMKSKLHLKGISDDIIENIFNIMEEENPDSDEMLCRDLLLSKYGRQIREKSQRMDDCIEEKSYEKEKELYVLYEKAKAFLYRKGFSLEVINKCINDLNDGGRQI